MYQSNQNFLPKNESAQIKQPDKECTPYALLTRIVMSSKVRM